MHVGAVLVFDGPAPALRRVRHAHPLAPAPGAALPPEARVPAAGVRAAGLGRRPAASTSSYHVRHTALPAPGAEEQLRALAARIYSQRLDRAKPLWEMWLVQGLEDGRFALISKTHHALVDGVVGRRSGDGPVRRDAGAGGRAAGAAVGGQAGAERAALPRAGAAGGASCRSSSGGACCGPRRIRVRRWSRRGRRWRASARLRGRC